MSRSKNQRKQHTPMKKILKTATKRAVRASAKTVAFEAVVKGNADATVIDRRQAVDPWDHD